MRRAAVGIVIGICVCLAYEAPSQAHGASFTVMTTIDEHDESPGDSVCLGASGSCSLRAAVEEANALVGSDDITVPAGDYALSLSRPDWDVAQPLSIMTDMVIRGGGAGTTTLSGDRDAAVFLVSSANAVEISDMTIRDGQPGIWLMNGNLSLRRVWLTGNVGVSGGALANSGDLVVADSTISGNDAQFGAAIYSYIANSLTVVNSTISGNTGQGGAIHHDSSGPGLLQNVTVYGNSGFGVLGHFTPVTMINTVVAHNMGGDCGGAVSGGGNLDSDGTCALSGASDITGRDPELGSLMNNGGATMTHLPAPSSPLIDAGDDANCPGSDQRGGPRSLDGDGDGIPRCDIGAVEVAAVDTVPPTFSPTPVVAPEPTASRSMELSVTPTPREKATLTSARSPTKGTTRSAASETVKVAGQDGSGTSTVLWALGGVGVLAVLGMPLGWYLVRHHRRQP